MIEHLEAEAEASLKERSATELIFSIYSRMFACIHTRIHICMNVA